MFARLKRGWVTRANFFKILKKKEFSKDELGFLFCRKAREEIIVGFWYKGFMHEILRSRDFCFVASTRQKGAGAGRKAWAIRNGRRRAGCCVKAPSPFALLFDWWGKYRSKGKGKVSLDACSSPSCCSQQFKMMLWSLILGMITIRHNNN